jgi:hypothetical protein
MKADMRNEVRRLPDGRIEIRFAHPISAVPLKVQLVLGYRRSNELLMNEHDQWVGYCGALSDWIDMIRMLTPKTADRTASEILHALE